MAAISRSIGQAQQPDLAALREQLLRPLPRVSWKVVGAAVLIVAAYYWGIQGTKASPMELIDGLPYIWNFVSRLFPPQFDTVRYTLGTPAIPLVFGLEIPGLPTGIEYNYPTILNAILQTVQMAIVGTTLGIVFATPFAIMASRNISHPVIYNLTRFFLNTNRAVPEIIWALIFVAAVGLGPFGGVLALAIGSIGFKAKIYAEAIEAIDPQQVLAVRATGASRLQTVVYAVAPQALPVIASYSLLSFETNIRAATILGIVGAGGVGFQLQKYMALFQFRYVCGTVLLIIVVVTVIDRISDRIRKRLI